MRLKIKKIKPKRGQENPLSMIPSLRFVSIDDYNKWSESGDHRFCVPAFIKNGNLVINNPAYADAQFELKHIWPVPDMSRSKRK